MIGRYECLVIETHSYCNRLCRTCMRQSNPNRSRWKGEEKIREFLPIEIIADILEQGKEMMPNGPDWAPERYNYKPGVVLQWYSEPLLDPRLPQIVRMAHDKGFWTSFDTNGDFLTSHIAEQFDGYLDRIEFSIYGDDPTVARPENEIDGEWAKQKIRRFQSMFKKTDVKWDFGHIVTHYSPDERLNEMIAQNVNKICQGCDYWCIFDYTGEMALCCEDIDVNFNLGNIRDSSLRDLWYSPKHQKISETLRTEGGRNAFPFCRMCPMHD